MWSPSMMMLLELLEQSEPAPETERARGVVTLAGEGRGQMALPALGYCRQNVAAAAKRRRPRNVGREGRRRG